MVKHLMVIVCLVLLLVPAVEARKGWFRYKTPRYGFQMMVPFETAFHDKVWSGGWSGLVGTLQELKIYAMTLHGKVVSPEELEALALSKTETTKDQWNEVTEGSGNGWIWSRTIKIRKDDDVFFGSYGGSKTSSFLIFLHTTKDDFTAKEEAYQYWRKNVKLLTMRKPLPAPTKVPAIKAKEVQSPPKKQVKPHKNTKIIVIPAITSQKALSKGMYIVPGKKGWQKYSNQKHGYSMEVPAGTQIVEKNFSNGWSGLVATRGPLNFWGITHSGMGRKAIEDFCVELTGINKEQWQLIDESQENGWLWMRKVKAKVGNNVLYGGYGKSKKGSYIFVFKTLAIDFRYCRENYDKWFESLTLDD